MTSFKAIRSAIRRELRIVCTDERATAAIEYALVASGISIVIAATVYVTGDRVKALYDSVAAIF